MKSDKEKVSVKNKSSRKVNVKLIKRLLTLPTGQKACVLILLMGILGAVVGGISAEIEIRRCFLTEQCFIKDTAQKRLDSIGEGAFAGMGAAIFASLPVLLRSLR